MEKVYVIDDVEYVITPPYLAVLQHVSHYLSRAGVTEGMSPAEIAMAVGERLPDALAAMLTPRGMHPRDKDLAALAEAFRWSEKVAVSAAEVVDDFFAQPGAVRGFVGLISARSNLALPLLPRICATPETLPDGSDSQTSSSTPPSS